MTLHSEMTPDFTNQRRLCWDEGNRLLLSADEEQLAGYVYDAAGMRTHKASGTIAASTVNGYPSYFGNISSMTLYPSELITVSTGMYTKHYYNGSQRLASRIGGGFAPHPDLNHYDPLTDQVELPHTGDYQRKAQALVDLWTRQTECAGLQPSLEFSYTLAEGNLHNPVSEPADGERYFYHSDHLGSSAFITTEMRSIREDLQKSNTTEQNGYATQFLTYLPFGETLNEEQNSSNYYSPFKFSAKEKDPEMRSIREDRWKINLTEQTGYSYFGARYYSPELSVWLSVDPLSDKYPSLSAYNYCAWNPVMLVDPDGRSIEDPLGCNLLETEIQTILSRIDHENLAANSNISGNNPSNSNNPGNTPCLDCPSTKNFEYKNREIFNSSTGQDYVLHDNSWHAIGSQNTSITFFDGEFRTVEIDRIKMFEAEYIYNLQMKSGLIDAIGAGSATSIIEKIVTKSVGKFSLPVFIGTFAEGSKAEVELLFERMELYDSGVDAKRSSK